MNNSQALHWSKDRRKQQISEMLRNKGYICRDFLVCVSCPRGPSCPYMHIRNGEVRPIPRHVCAFFKREVCLRDQCTFFHGTQAQLDLLHAQQAETYRPQDYMQVVVPPAQYLEPDGTIKAPDDLPLAVIPNQTSNTAVPPAAISNQHATTAVLQQMPQPQHTIYTTAAPSPTPGGMPTQAYVMGANGSPIPVLMMTTTAAVTTTSTHSNSQTSNNGNPNTTTHNNNNNNNNNNVVHHLHSAPSTVNNAAAPHGATMMVPGSFINATSTAQLTSYASPQQYVATSQPTVPPPPPHTVPLQQVQHPSPYTHVSMAPSNAPQYVTFTPSGGHVTCIPSGSVPVQNMVSTPPNTLHNPHINPPAFALRYQ